MEENYQESFEKEEEKEQSLPLIDDNASDIQPKQPISPHDSYSVTSKKMSEAANEIEEIEQKPPQMHKEEQPS